MIKIMHKDVCCGGCCYDMHIKERRNNVLKIIQIIFCAFLIILGGILEDKTLSFNIIYIYLIAYILVGIEVFIDAFKHIIKGKIFNESTLMIIATICAFIAKEYEEAVIVIELFQIGELLEDVAVNKAHQSIENLLHLPDLPVRKITNNNIVNCNITLVELGDKILVHKDEIIPLDGTIVKGDCLVDESTINGNSNIRKVSINSNVISGSINKGNDIEILVNKTYTHSTVHKILDYIEEKTISRTKSKNFVNTFAKIYTPIIVCLALLVVLIPTIIFKQDINVWLYKACLFLVVSCPCAIVISVPLAYYLGIGVVSKIGILSKGINYINLIDNNDDNEILKVSNKIKQKINNIVNENIISVILVKSIAMIWGLFGELPIFVALISDVGICLLCIANCLRLLINKRRV